MRGKAKITTKRRVFYFLYAELGESSAITVANDCTITTNIRPKTIDLHQRVTI